MDLLTAVLAGVAALASCYTAGAVAVNQLRDRRARRALQDGPPAPPARRNRAQRRALSRRRS